MAKSQLNLSTSRNEGKWLFARVILLSYLIPLPYSEANFFLQDDIVSKHFNSESFW